MGNRNLSEGPQGENMKSLGKSLLQSYRLGPDCQRRSSAENILGASSELWQQKKSQ